MEGARGWPDILQKQVHYTAALELQPSHWPDIGWTHHDGNGHDTAFVYIGSPARGKGGLQLPASKDGTPSLQALPGK